MWGCCPNVLREREAAHLAIDDEAHRRSKNPLGKLTVDDPIRVTCHICGRGAGTLSLKHHYDKCAALFIAHQALVPSYRRRQLPAPPNLAIPQKPGAELETYNRAAAKIYHEVSTI